MRPATVFLLSALIIGSLEAKPNIKNFFSKHFFKDVYGTIDANIKVGDAGKPLILTDLIQQDQIDEAQAAAEVKLDAFLGVKSYAGYFRVDEIYDSNLFFWFFPSQSNFEKDPVIVWLQGGPGAPSELGLFGEIGPFDIIGDKLVLRNTSWTTSSSILFIDQPAGTGFSFTNGGYAQNQTKVGDDLYEAIYQFFQLFPVLQSNDFFVAGESYGGKYVPALGYTILKKNPTGEIKINLKGLAIGNGLTDPKHQYKFADYLLQLGLVDDKERDMLKEIENQVAEKIDNEDWLEASKLIDDEFDAIDSTADLADIHNYLVNYSDFDDFDTDELGDFLRREDIRKAIHVGNTPFQKDGNVYANLQADIPKSVAPLVAELLEHYRILVYNGQLDTVVPYSTTVEYLQNLDFVSAEEYKNAERRKWRYGSDVAGYIKSAGNLTEVLVRNAGHLVPADQPEWALDLINKFMTNNL
ncbi:unnamed protein product [Psylliodes chrysocephalus]|uniref:Carboxypeptidase n=1 Tax=Psylliodes chrysocephalus TaxID=3402493 RepID=A0A9P0CVI5_9CUCU|nr:unnamed protein product [Psylliodes chrysocephala]